MASVKVGDEIPSGVFVHVPFTPELEEHSACGIRTYSRSVPMRTRDAECLPISAR